MPDRLRRAGRGRDTEGWWVIWSVAEGKRGRRWREVRYGDRGVASSLLLETSPEGRFTHLELSTSSGLLTLHPEGDGTLHGNAIAPGGVEHLRGLAWDAEALVLIEGSPISQAAAAQLLRAAAPGQNSTNRQAATILRTLRLEVGPIKVERITESEWRFGGGTSLQVDDRGLPLLDEAETWPLEESDEA